MSALERAAIALASLGLSILLIALLSGFFTSRDSGALEGSATIAGQRFRDLGDALLKPGQPRPHYDSAPPTSGPHLPAQVVRDQAPLSDDQLLAALAAGDVVIFYGSRTPAPALISLAASLAPPFTRTLAAAGDAVIVSPRPGTSGVIALAWAHMLRLDAATDPRLRQFAGFWLGRGAPRSGATAP